MFLSVSVLYFAKQAQLSFHNIHYELMRENAHEKYIDKKSEILGKPVSGAGVGHGPFKIIFKIGLARCRSLFRAYYLRHVKKAHLQHFETHHYSNHSPRHRWKNLQNFKCKENPKKKYFTECR